jgi:hypothetical protein
MGIAVCWFLSVNFSVVFVKGVAYIMVLSCKYHNFVELGQVGEEIINARSLCCPPSLLSLRTR